jgi:hypothetical protein
MKILKTLSFFTFFGLTNLIACGPGNFYSTFAQDNYYDFLPSKLINIDAENPLYSFTSGGSSFAYNERVTYYAQLKKEFNVQEWYEYFHKKMSKKELEELFYSEHSTLLKRYEKLAKKIDNPFFEKYLNLVAKQLKNVSGYEKHTYSSSTLSEEALGAFTEESDSFLKLRYLFLSMRLAHYGGDYKRSLSIYDKHYIEVAKVKSVVVEWIDALRAGALQHLGRSLESNLLYVKIFKKNKTNAHLGYYDFKVKNDKSWKALLSSTKNSDEKAIFYFLRALKWEGSPLHEHEVLAKLAPKSIWFERLTYMLMQEFQEDVFAYENSEDKKNKYILEERKVYVLKEKRFLETMSSLKSPSFFDLYSQVYLSLLKNGKLSEKQRTRLEKLSGAKEKVYLNLLTYIEALKELDRSKQKELSIHFEHLSKKLTQPLEESLFRYTALHNSRVYPSLSAKAFYSKMFSDKSGMYTWQMSRDSIRADSFESYVEEKNRNFYEERLFKESMKILEKGDVAKTLALLYSKEGNFKKADHYLKQIPKLNRTTSYNPFNVSLSGNNRKSGKKEYKQRKFVSTMLNIEKSLKKNPNSAMDHFLYANGLYNSSWFGNSPMFSSIWRTTTSIDPERVKHVIQQLDLAQIEYKKALKYATKKEFKAKIAYQLLKIEFNKKILLPNSVYLPEFGSSWNSITLKDYVTESKSLRISFLNYEKQYKRTKFGKEIIGSCVTFSYFR